MKVRARACTPFILSALGGKRTLKKLARCKYNWNCFATFLKKGSKSSRYPFFRHVPGHG